MKDKIICIHQPDFVPYIGFFQRLVKADHYVILDDVQFIRRGWHHRDKIKSENGPVWLSLSIKKGDLQQRINETKLVRNAKWISANLNLISHCYRKAKCFEEIYYEVEKIYMSGHERMIDINIAFLNFMINYLDINIEITYSSDFNTRTGNSERLLDLVKCHDGNCYLTGTGSKNYLDVELFARSDVKVVWQEFYSPIYQQVHGAFEPMLSCLDLLFNCGRHASGILRESIYD